MERIKLFSVNARRYLHLDFNLLTSFASPLGIHWIKTKAKSFGRQGI
jgi:hypothetical protein